jgi:hypothetical protein
MAFDNQLFALCHGLRRWATATPSVKRMWIYGSRAAGTQRPDDDPNPSDLDIAVDIDEMPERDSDTFRRGRFADWRTEVQAIVAPYHLHLEIYLGSPGVKESVDACSLLFYQRADSAVPPGVHPAELRVTSDAES